MTTGEFFRSIMIVFAALCIGQVIFAVVVSLPGVSKTSPELYNILQWLVPIGGVAEILIFKFISQRRFSNVSGNLGNKIGEYRAIMITTWASHEGATFFALIAYMLTSEISFLVYALVFFVLMLPTAPFKAHFIRHVVLNKEELSLLNNDASKVF